MAGLSLAEPPFAIEVEELEGVLRVPGPLSLGIAEEADGPDCDDPDAVIGFGDMCWSGAGCVNGARPVLRGGYGAIDRDEIL